MKRFKEGDVVREKTGGPKMTIEERHKTGNCTCVWFKDSILFREYFLAIHLARA